MKNVHFFKVSIGNPKTEEELQPMMSVEPTAHILSTFGISRLALRNTVALGRFVVVVTKDACRDIDRISLKKTIGERIEEREKQLDRVLNEDERAGLVDGVTAEVAAHAQIISKYGRAIIFLDSGIAIVEGNSFEGARKSLKFITKAFNPAPGYGHTDINSMFSYAGVMPDTAMRLMLTNTDFLLAQKDIEIGDSCQIRDRESDAIYTVRKGDLFKKDAQDLINSGKKMIKRLAVVMMEPLEEGQEPDDQLETATFSLDADGGVKSIKMSSYTRGIVGTLIHENGFDDEQASDIVHADMMRKILRFYMSLLEVKFDEEETGS